MENNILEIINELPLSRIRKKKIIYWLWINRWSYYKSITCIWNQCLQPSIWYSYWKYFIKIWKTWTTMCRFFLSLPKQFSTRFTTSNKCLNKSIWKNQKFYSGHNFWWY
jgi:hypothetical protein